MYSLRPCFVGIVIRGRVEEHSQGHHVLIQLGQIPHANDQHFVERRLTTSGSLQIKLLKKVGAFGRSTLEVLSILHT